MRKFLKRFAICCIAGIGLLLSATAALYVSALHRFDKPEVAVRLSDYPVAQWTDSLRICKDNYLLLNPDGLWEGRIEGPAAERGAVLGLLSKDILQNQEQVFVEQIHRFIPSERYIRFLHKLIVLFNRNMARHIPAEYLEEIYAMSLSCSDAYDDYGNPYIRQLNYHAAHDIGHTMQEYMLVGCSSFAAWGEESAEGGLLVGRNFDFYFGSEFARNKIVLFVRPDEGYRYASVTWPGMMGVVSGMNESGLTVTINAAKGAIPTSSAMPISLLARHILQYAGTIAEAVEIARAHQTFVSESLLIASAADNRAAIIEKTPDQTELYTTDVSRIICTNHYQSALLANERHNAEALASSDTRYRYDRLTELLGRSRPLDLQRCADILRDRYGLNDEDIGLTNEKSINQFIAHHSVIFEPGKLKMWVSTAPWQSGAYIGYDLNEVFAADREALSAAGLSCGRIPADTLFLQNDLARVEAFRRQTAALQQAVKAQSPLPPHFIDSYIDNNPNLYAVYDLAGDYRQAMGETDAALSCWEQALTKEIPHLSTRRQIEKKINRHAKKQGSAL